MLFPQSSSRPMEYPFEDKQFKTFTVHFSNTSIIDDEYLKPGYNPKKISNEPHILTMVVGASPDSDAFVELDHAGKKVIITTKPNGYMPENGRPCLLSEPITRMIDTTRYTHFVVNMMK